MGDRISKEKVFVYRRGNIRLEKLMGVYAPG